MKRGLIISTLISEFSKQHVFVCEQPDHVCLRSRCISQKTQSQIIYYVKQDSFENQDNMKNEQFTRYGIISVSKF